jgi:hypothetical protein
VENEVPLLTISKLNTGGEQAAVTALTGIKKSTQGKFIWPSKAESLLSEH